jgi:hypothetical protein
VTTIQWTPVTATSKPSAIPSSLSFRFVWFALALAPVVFAPSEQQLVPSA